MAYTAAMPKAPPPAELGTQRDALPYFAGREAELTALRQRLDRLRSTGDPRGGMSLIMGVPGVGKTQLGLTFARHALSSKGRPKVLHLALSTSLLESDIDLFMAIAATLNADKIGREVAELDSNGTRRDCGLAGLRGGTHAETRTAHGALAEDPPGAVSFGIPSFHGYMVELSRANRA